MPTGARGNRRKGRHNGSNGSFSEHSKRPPSKSSQLQANTVNIANAKRSYERYMALARNAASTSDAVEIENFYQHAEHYLRLMNGQAV